MDQLTQNPALVASLLLLLTMLLVRQRRTKAVAARSRKERLDTVQAWPAQLVPAMSPVQRDAHELLRQAVPGHVVLFQVPLSQFMRVSTRQSYAEWYRRAGRLRAAFLVCDAQSNVLAAVALHQARDSQREQDRHERLSRTLRSMGLPVIDWHEGDLPTPAQVRQSLGPLLARVATSLEQVPARVVDLRDELSGDAEAMGVEATDFGAFTTLPAPLDSRLM